MNPEHKTLNGTKEMCNWNIAWLHNKQPSTAVFFLGEAHCVMVHVCSLTKTVLGSAAVFVCPAGSGGKRRSFPCNQCPFVATDRVGHERHQRTHTGEQPFACPLCGRRFNHKSNMATHMRRHTGEKPFPCDACGRQFGFKVALVKHMQEEHGTEPLRCIICSAVFASQGGLDAHARGHTEEPRFMCSLCMRPFKHKRNLARHMELHAWEEKQRAGGHSPPPVYED
ncbi:uncharacterized protein [Dermacentor andersoni]|uniref:uncharacterized protein isoform X1 n=1 Tax=Dermacentor andersoni TaxID=34620 RepID=UPI00241668FD|nr:gastrula zinc finger protein XlCGF8.2DB-like isoform X1 [Dermacentor andersoni]XP_054925956.1 gastrula zinc finger protein XlCGF8.2DB-like isoform X1 [Dermacentor andersoni]XP_054925957.1 gastrula zinc finger protein XlCGF8.2DB-like isoform X1 [Dermacentor andersoni]XP_054925959.1 gastrula zinc finger protein XlCGF8.2DB-like isoform X1 [Dermacentor andersoni]